MPRALRKVYCDQCGYSFTFQKKVDRHKAQGKCKGPAVKPSHLASNVSAPDAHQPDNRGGAQAHVNEIQAHELAPAVHSASLFRPLPAASSVGIPVTPRASSVASSSRFRPGPYDDSRTSRSISSSRPSPRSRTRRAIQHGQKQEKVVVTEKPELEVMTKKRSARQKQLRGETAGEDPEQQRGSWRDRSAARDKIYDNVNGDKSEQVRAELDIISPIGSLSPAYFSPLAPLNPWPVNPRFSHATYPHSNYLVFPSPRPPFPSSVFASPPRSNPNPRNPFDSYPRCHFPSSPTPGSRRGSPTMDSLYCGFAGGLFLEEEEEDEKEDMVMDIGKEEVRRLVGLGLGMEMEQDE